MRTLTGINEITAFPNTINPISLRIVVYFVSNDLPILFPVVYVNNMFTSVIFLKNFFLIFITNTF